MIYRTDKKDKDELRMTESALAAIEVAFIFKNKGFPWFEQGSSVPRGGGGAPVG